MRSSVIEKRGVKFPPIVFVALLVALIGFWQAYNADKECTEIEQHKARIKAQQSSLLLPSESAKQHVLQDYRHQGSYSESELLSRRKQELSQQAKNYDRKHNQKYKNNQQTIIKAEKPLFSTLAE